MRLLQTGDNIVAVVMFIGIYTAFHFSTLEEYYVGTLYLPIFNGVSDGSFAIIAGGFITGILGNSVWTTPIFDVSWLQIRGIEIMTIGQLFALIIGFSNAFIGVGK